MAQFNAAEAENDHRSERAVSRGNHKAEYSGLEIRRRIIVRAVEAFLAKFEQCDDPRSMNKFVMILGSGDKILIYIGDTGLCGQILVEEEDSTGISDNLWTAWMYSCTRRRRAGCLD